MAPFDRLGAVVREADARVDGADVVGSTRAHSHAYCSLIPENPGLVRLLMNLGAKRAEVVQRPEGGPLDELSDPAGAPSTPHPPSPPTGTTSR